MPADDLDKSVLLARVIRYLEEAGDTEAINLLNAWPLQIRTYDPSRGNYDYPLLVITLEIYVPRSVYERLRDGHSPDAHLVQQAIAAVLPEATEVEVVPVYDTRDAAGFSNQAVLAETDLFKWKNLNFRSRTEVLIAEALDRAGVLFFPNSAARVGQPADRRTREVDFLICHDGSWGILEVDGEPSHPATRSALEHAQDRHFKGHGLLAVERYDARACWKDPDGVVREYLALLEQHKTQG